MSDKYGYIGIETLLNFCSNNKNHCVTPNDFMRMNRVKIDDRPHGEWIPVSERLPEEKINPVTHDFEEVLGTTIWGDVRHYKYGTPVGHDEAHFWYGFGIMDEEVIAWMPLPEPYKKEGEAE